MRWSPARLLAPLALAACAIAIYSIVNSNLLSDGSKGNTTTTSTTKAKKGKHPGARKHRRKRPKYYVVKAGDVLSAISIHFHVPLDKLMELNPHLDAQTLQAGQRIRLR